MSSFKTFHWEGKIDGYTEDHWRLHQIVKDETLKHEGHEGEGNFESLALAPTKESSWENGYALIGYASHEGVRRVKGRIGAEDGPNEIRRALANMPVHEKLTFVDWGNVYCKNGDVEACQYALSERVCNAMDAGFMPIVIGGGHDMGFGNYMGLYAHYHGVHGKARHHHDGERIGIINFDAHFDIREADANSGTSFYQVAEFNRHHGRAFKYMCLGVAKYANTKVLFDRAKKWRVPFIVDEEFHLSKGETVLPQLDKFLKDVDHLYVTVDLDVFASYIAPGVSAPSVRGINLVTFEKYFHYIVNSGKVRLLDLAECNPSHDTDERTSKLAAYIIHSFIFRHV